MTYPWLSRCQRIPTDPVLSFSSSSNLFSNRRQHIKMKLRRIGRTLLPWNFTTFSHSVLYESLGVKNKVKYTLQLVSVVLLTFLFFFVCFFFLFSFTNIRESQGLQGKREGVSLTSHYHFYPLHRHLDISRVITAESSPLHIASSRARTGNLSTNISYNLSILLYK